MRASNADTRDRHQGVSHHTITTLTIATQSRVTVPLPMVEPRVDVDLRADLEAAGITARHDVLTRPIPDVLELLAARDLHVTSMGRPAADDPILFQCAAAAGAQSVISLGERVT